ncbi:unnamed protein product [[Candida] boidinii]|nr:unnamed protein product [[Candida] boidinii]
MITAHTSSNNGIGTNNTNSENNNSDKENSIDIDSNGDKINKHDDIDENNDGNSDGNEYNSFSKDQIRHIAQKAKELTTFCVGAMERTKKMKTVLNLIRSVESPTEEQKARTYEETNLFLKSIITILAATKSAINDIPLLNEIRGALSNLTRATKELTIKLETSSLKNSVMNLNSNNNETTTTPATSATSATSATPATPATSATSTTTSTAAAAAVPTAAISIAAATSFTASA